MSQNNIPDKLPSVEKLLQRVASAEKSQQREIRISIQEARELTQELALLTSKLSIVVSEINTKLSELQKSSGVVQVTMDGGGF
jgi:hypothetical protein